VITEAGASDKVAALVYVRVRRRDVGRVLQRPREGGAATTRILRVYSDPAAYSI